jgi:hypothetical protein
VTNRRASSGFEVGFYKKQPNPPCILYIWNCLVSVRLAQ